MANVDFSDAQKQAIRDMLTEQSKMLFKDIVEALHASIHESRLVPAREGTGIQQTPDRHGSFCEYSSFNTNLKKVMEETFFKQILKKYDAVELAQYRYVI